jgi:uncharacterized membrane protein HdeD (DUF308 family)
MSVATRPDSWGPAAEPLHTLQKSWIWFVLLGIALVIVGFVAVGSAVLATLATTVFLGFLLLFGGGIEIASAFLSGRWRAFFTHLLVGILYVILGIFMIEKPLTAAAGLTLLVGAAFLVGGVFRIVLAFTQNFQYRFLVLLNGAVMTVLGFLIWRGWPEDTLWIIGLFVGIELIFDGAMWIAFGLGVRTMLPPVDAAAPPV